MYADSAQAREWDKEKPAPVAAAAAPAVTFDREAEQKRIKARACDAADELERRIATWSKK